jgi:hypothetical protein
MSKDLRTNAEKKLRNQTRKINNLISKIKKNHPVIQIQGQELQALYITANGNSNISLPGLKKLKKLLIHEAIAQAQQESLE